MGLGWLVWMGLARVALAAEPLPRCGPLEPGAYVLTMSPGESVQNVFGHTALLVADADQGEWSTVYDFGRYELGPPLEQAWAVLNMEQPYYVSARPLSQIVERYANRERSVVVQQLALTNDQITSLTSGVVRKLNDDPYFAYNWYRPNCTTEIQDRLDAVLGGALSAQHGEVSDTSPAREVLRHSSNLVPLWFGLHWGSGRIADRRISHWEGMFLPDGLRRGLARSQTPDGEPLVVHECVLVDAGSPSVPTQPPSRFGWLLAVGLVWGGVVAGLSWLRRGVGLAVVSAQGLAVGLFGSAAVLVGSLGTFAPFWGHHNLAFANPGHLLLAAMGVVAWRRPASQVPAAVTGLLCGAAGGGVVAAIAHVGTDRNLGIIALLLPPLLAALWALRPVRP